MAKKHHVRGKDRKTQKQVRERGHQGTTWGRGTAYGRPIHTKEDYE